MFIHVPPNHLCCPRRCQPEEELWEVQSHPCEVQGWSLRLHASSQRGSSPGDSPGGRPSLHEHHVSCQNKPEEEGTEEAEPSAQETRQQTPNTHPWAPPGPGKGPPQPRWEAARDAGAGPGPAGGERRRKARTPPPPGPAARRHSRARPTRDGSSRSNRDRLGVRGQACWSPGPAVSGRRSEMERGGPRAALG